MVYDDPMNTDIRKFTPASAFSWADCTSEMGQADSSDSEVHFSNSCLSDFETDLCSAFFKQASTRDYSDDEEDSDDEVPEVVSVPPSSVSSLSTSVSLL